MNYCQGCGAQSTESARFCEKCGAALQPPAPQAAPPVTPYASAPAKKRSFVVPVVILVVLLVLAAGALGVGFVLFGPMSEDEYEDAAQDYVNDLYEAQSEVDSAVYYMYFTMDALENDSDAPWPEDELESSDVGDARDALDDGAEEIRAMAAELEKLRPPKEYKDEHEALVAWAQYMVDQWVPGYEELVSAAEDDMTYGEFSEEYDELMNDLSEDGDDIWEDYWDAAEEVDID